MLRFVLQTNETNFATFRSIPAGDPASVTLRRRLISQMWEVGVAACRSATLFIWGNLAALKERLQTRIAGFLAFPLWGEEEAQIGLQGLLRSTSAIFTISVKDNLVDYTGSITGNISGLEMKFRTKLLFVLACLVLLEAAQGMMYFRFVSETRSAAVQLGTNTVMESSAAFGMLDAITELETALTAADNRNSGTASTFAIRTQGEQSNRKFHRYFNEAAGGGWSEMEISIPNRTAALQHQSALLKNIQGIHSAIEHRWQDYTNALTTSPEKARSILDQSLLPILHEQLRPALTDYCRELAHESTLPIQHLVQRTQHAEKIMFLFMGLTLLVFLATGFFLVLFILKPLEDLARATKKAATGNFQGRLQLKLADRKSVV